MAKQDFLVELGTEELPPKALQSLSIAFANGIIDGLKAANLKHSNHQVFATPRRLALLISQLETEQPDQEIERRGPALTAAFDADGKPTKAAEGFAKSCGTTVDNLDTLTQGKNAWLVYRTVQKGSKASVLLPSIVDKSVDSLPIPKRMRWGAKRDEFVRPVQWLVMMLGQDVINCEILGQHASNITYGHRFHCGRPLPLTAPKDYAKVLKEQGSVVADFAIRKKQIYQQVEVLAKTISGHAVIDESLLDEVTALVEWPVALLGSFDERFLAVPAEALISSMKGHQKYFHLIDKNQQLLPNFITISNIESKDPSQVISGNEKVIRPRLADAMFFFETDKKKSLFNFRDKLKPIVFQAKLGSVFDKTERVAKLASYIATIINGDAELALRAGQLCKSDLASEMVLEFPELQGTMGYYYAQNDDEHAETASALYEQYMPRFAGDQVATTTTGAALAIADKLDTLVGIFAIGQLPTGTKDPFGLRRAALGILRTIIEKSLDLDLLSCIQKAIELHTESNSKLNAANNLQELVFEFLLERFRAWYHDEGIAAEVFMAVKALKPAKPLDFDQRIKAVARFTELPEATALAEANKRVSNILEKQGKALANQPVDEKLLREKAEQQLAKALNSKRQEVAPLFQQRSYTAALEALASLKDSIDNFFDDVLVNAEDTALRQNRYALLRELRALFLGVADISLLTTK
ncbi:glycine--tRNA ligase subunit beta [Zooshikella harenae]|uniref:Glycine--tRNA ligase beta subunit n=1 Tax=Zooshikella harenae TaxID=2827238 RepID=A0ABS5ZCF0_9GAMM|nr:glycine--tRNA ligase subunit beta [Zooshikella harenae]MBU2711695.1 glycine--tRNA ligase subunit beta [Zooshikella harenae]